MADSLSDLISTLNNLNQNVGRLVQGFLTATYFTLNSTRGTNTVGTTASVVVTANSRRAGLLFHNVSDTAELIVFPSTVTADFTNRGGGFLIVPQDFLLLTGSDVTLAWSAIADSGASNPLTISES